MREARVALIALFLAGAGCGRAPEPTPAEAPLAAPTVVAPAPGDLAPGDPAPGDPAPALPAAVTGLSPESRAALAAAPVPMLLLPAEYARGTTVTSGERWAALSYRDDELTISLHATDRAHPVVPEEEIITAPPADESVRGEPARVLVNELIRSVAWTEGEVAYALEVECAQPEADPRCTERAFVLELADRLVPAGGAR